MQRATPPLRPPPCTLCSAGLLATLLWLGGCASLLPDSNSEAKTPWNSYDEAAATFTKITPGKTSLSELRALGYDPEHTANVALLSHADLLRRLQAMATFEGPALDPALKQCVAAGQACFAYRIEQQSMVRERVGGFWLDFFNFRRDTKVTGWQFDALVLISRGVVIYKSWSGKPNIHEMEHEHHPLGPLQGIGSSLR